jgi:PKD domain
MVLVLAVGTGSAAEAASAGTAQAGTAQAGTAQAPALLACGEGAAQTRPASIILACADDGELAEHLVWSSWTASSAAASGDVTWKACATKCADGKQWDSAAADITLSRPADEPGQGLLFTRLTLDVTGSTPSGFQRQVTFSEVPLPAAVTSPNLAPESQARPALEAAPSGSLSYSHIEGFWQIAGGPTGLESTGAGTYTIPQIAAAITGAESSFLPGIIQPGVDYCGAGADRAGWGLWQITCGNSVPAFGTDFQLLDPWNNAEAAVSKYKADAAAGVNGFDPWSTFLSGAFEQFLQTTSADTNLTNPGEYDQINATPPGTPSSPAPDPGSTSGPPMPGGPPSAAFSTSAGSLLQEQPVTFNGSGSKPGAGTSIKSYSWNFGDGTTASGSKVTHEFVTSAPVTVKLTVTGSNGKTASVTRSYFVLPTDSSASNYITPGGQDQEHVFYESSAGALEQSWYDTSKWNTQPLTGSPTADPVTLNYTGAKNQEHVFFVGSGGAIVQDFYNGSAWINQTLPGKAASGSALGGTNYIFNGHLQQHVFYIGTGGSLAQTWYTGTQWDTQSLPGKPVTGSPIVSSVYITPGGVLQQHVFFIGAGDTLQQSWYTGSEWVNQDLPGKPELGQNSLATSDYLNGSTPQEHVFFIGSGGTLQQSWYTGTAWASQQLPGAPVLSGGLVTSDLSSNQQHVFFIGASDKLEQTWWNGTAWNTQPLPGTGTRVLGTNDYPGASMQQHVFFVAPSNALEQSWWTGKEWVTQALPGAAVTG